MKLKNLWRRLTGRLTYNYWSDVYANYDPDQDLYKIVFTIVRQGVKVYHLPRADAEQLWHELGEALQEGPDNEVS